MNITIQKATLQDTPFLATMILQSSRAEKTIGLFEYLFDASSQKTLTYIEALLQSEYKPYCYYENFLVAKIGTQPIGCLCAYEPRKVSKESFFLSCKALGLDIESMQIRYSVLEECNFEIDKRVVLFDFLEEDETMLDVGVLKALMQKALLNARLKGYRIAQTLIEIGSLEAKLFYEALGFQLKEQKECQKYQEIFGRKGQMLFELTF